MQTTPGHSFLLAVVAFTLAVAVLPAQAEPPPAAPPLSEAESWTISQIRSGSTADLSAHFPTVEDGKRTLHARFLKDLLTGALPVEMGRNQRIHIVGAVFDESVALDGETVVHGVDLRSCYFTKPVTFMRTVFSESTSFRDCYFLSDANFNGLKAKEDFYLGGSTFAAEATFGQADFARSFSATDTTFKSATTTANFLDMKVAGLASFDRAVFKGPVNFGSAEIGGSFTADGARFENDNSFVSFFYMKMKASAFFTNITFAGTVSFAGTHVAELLSLNGTQFKNKTVPPSFVNVRTGDNLSVNQVVFSGGAEFGSVTVGGFLIVYHSRFENPDIPARFLNIKVAETASFTDSTFAGPLILAESSFQTLLVSNTSLNAAPIPALNLEGGLIKHELALQRLHMRDFDTATLRVEGPAVLTELQVDHQADLSYDDFVTLALTGSRWPSPKNGVLLLRGMNYRAIVAAKDEHESHERLIGLLDQAVYTGDTYSNLETFFAHQGYSDDANEVFVAGKSRERRDNMSWHSPGFYWSWLLQGIGYGRYPERALYACALVVAFGCWAFKPAKMEPQEPGSFPRLRRYSRFWYSLELFLPIVELKAVDAWEPKSEQHFLRHYMRVHVLLGWILVPIALAAQAGLIK